jgi:AI-2 transport protein TqsA
MAETVGKNEKPRSGRGILLAVLVAIAAVFALKETYIVTMPIAAAFFVAIAIRPIQSWLDSRLPRWLRWLSLTLALLVAAAAVAAIAALIWLGVNTMASETPRYVEKFKEFWRGIAAWAGGYGVSLDGNLLQPQQVSEHLVALATMILASFSSVLAVLALIFFYTLLMLMELAAWSGKVERAFPQGKAEAVARAVDTVAYRIQRYIVARTGASAVAAAVEGGWLWIMGVDGAFLWTILIFLGNYVPNIGTTISFFPPSAIAVLQFGWGRGLVVIAGMVFLDQIINSYVTPVWFGRTLRVSPLVLLAALVFWSWLWGVAGAILAIPLTVTIVISCAHVDALKGVAVLLSGTADEEPAAKEPRKRPGRSRRAAAARQESANSV